MNAYYGKSVLSITLLSALGLTACNVDVNSDGRSTSKVTTTKTGVVVDAEKGLKVNDVTYDPSNASIVVNGLPGDESSIKKGMVVSVSGTDNSDGTGVASVIHYEDDLKGVVTGNKVDSDSSGTLDVMGQAVHIDKDTVFESYDVADLSPKDIEEGNIVEVSGYASGEGEIWATRIEVKDSQYYAGEAIELKGNISDVEESSFSIGKQVISTENAALDSDFMGVLKEGQYVEVKSDYGFSDDGVLLASAIDLKGTGEKEVRHTEEDEQVEIKGLITKSDDLSGLEVNGSKILLDEKYRDSEAELSQLNKGLMVEVEGYVDDSGKLVAKRLVIDSSKDESSSRDNDISSSDDRVNDLSSDKDSDADHLSGSNTSNESNDIIYETESKESDLNSIRNSGLSERDFDENQDSLSSIRDADSNHNLELRELETDNKNYSESSENDVDNKYSGISSFVDADSNFSYELVESDANRSSSNENNTYLADNREGESYIADSDISNSNEFRVAEVDSSYSGELNDTNGDSDNRDSRLELNEQDALETEND